jgi:hypothetical protein
MDTHDIGDAAWGEVTTPPREWRSGMWRLELRDDELADIRYDGRLVLRSIRGVARDRDWGTIPPRVVGVDVDGGRLTVDVDLVGRDADLSARLVVEAHDDTLDVSWECHVNQPFLRARLGLVVLHPPTVAGGALEVLHPDGSVEASRFPLEISAHQSAFEISGLRWEHEGVATTMAFAGDVFEMEDQRNWTDASFKTYSTPLALPFPVRVDSGTTIVQRIEITCSADAAATPHDEGDRIRLSETGRTVPSIGTSASTGPGTPPAATLGDTLLVELPAHTPAWRAALDRAVAEAAGLPLDVRIVASDEEQVDEVLAAVAPLRLARIGVFSSTTHVSEPALWRGLIDGLDARGLGVPTVGGTRGHFTELNRTLHRLPGDIPAHTFSVTPQMHATGREQIVESVAMMRLVAENAVRMTGTAVHIGPVTLRPRFNAVATSPTPDAQIVDVSAGCNAAVMDDATDARQSSAALAAWTVASAAALAVEGVESISWFENSGPRGLRDVDGTPFPVATALEWLAAIAGSPLLSADQTPAGLWAIGADSDGSHRVLVANLRPLPATVTVSTSTGEVVVAVPGFTARRVVVDDR